MNKESKVAPTIMTSNNAECSTCYEKINDERIYVNGKNCIIPSYELNVGDEISVREKSTYLLVISNSISNEDQVKMDW